MNEDGSLFQVVVPGLEQFDHVLDDAPATDGSRVELGQGSAPVFVLYATRDFKAGEKVGLSHGGLACSNGRRLMHCGQTLKQNPWDNVEVSLELKFAEDQIALLESLAEFAGQEGLSAWESRTPQPGDFLSADVVKGNTMVKLFKEDGQQKVLVTIRLMKQKPIPDKRLLQLLGVAMIADKA